ncbi:galactokinase [Streptomyces sp. NPDC101118]|uniref:galactokinase n=1 Tax=Streptomyces sp. NPDC101118 TaxID=3366109 RepID=UPI0037F4E3B3
MSPRPTRAGTASTERFGAEPSASRDVDPDPAGREHDDARRTEPAPVGPRAAGIGLNSGIPNPSSPGRGVREPCVPDSGSPSSGVPDAGSSDPCAPDAGSLARRATADPLFRLVAYALEAAHGRAPAAVWSAPHAFHLGSPGLVAAAGWPVAAAAAPRTDGQVRLSSLGHPAQSCTLPLAGRRPADVPPWAVRPYAVLRALAEAGYGRHGTDLHVHGTLTEAAGLSLAEPADCATALAVADAHAHAPDGEAPDRERIAAVLRALAPPGDEALRSAVLHAWKGSALLLGGERPRHVPFDPAASGARLVLMAARGTGTAEERAADLRAAADRARRAGAIGIWPPGAGPAPRSLLMMLPEHRRTAVRGAVAEEFRSRRRPVPRFLNISVAGAARRES